MTVGNIAISLEGISKTFGSVVAVDDVSLSIAKGELFGMIGPDGAGKSTLFRIMTSLLMPDSGVAVVNGYDTVKDYRPLRKIIGYMPGDFSLYRDLTVEENLTFFASIFNTTIEQNYHLIKDIYVQLEPFKRRRADQLSGGMKQKLALCCALIHEPEVLFLDEPTTGVDAVSRDEFWEMLARLIARGITIVVSTPYMDEASRCQRVALMQGGKILTIDEPANVSGSYAHPLFEVAASDMFALPAQLRSMPYTLRAERFGEYVHLSTRNEIDPERIRTDMSTAGNNVLHLRPINATVEDVFLDLTSS